MEGLFEDEMVRPRRALPSSQRGGVRTGVRVLDCSGLDLAHLLLLTLGKQTC